MGSRGRGEADRFSDVDFALVATPEAHARLAQAWRAALEAAATVVFWAERNGRVALLNAITADWLRCDLTIHPPFALPRWSRATVRPLFDRAGIVDGLPAMLPEAKPDPERVRVLIEEFLRVLGLLPVGYGRAEWVLLVRGAGLLRELMAELMIEECPLPDRGGALHPTRVLGRARMAQLEALPFPGPEPEALIEAHVRIAEAFLPVARRIAAEAGVEWPAAFEAATRAHLARELGLRFA